MDQLIQTRTSASGKRRTFEKVLQCHLPGLSSTQAQKRRSYRVSELTLSAFPEPKLAEKGTSRRMSEAGDKWEELLDKAQNKSEVR